MRWDVAFAPAEQSSSPGVPMLIALAEPAIGVVGEREPAAVVKVPAGCGLCETVVVQRVKRWTQDRSALCGLGGRVAGPSLGCAECPWLGLSARRPASGMCANANSRVAANPANEFRRARGYRRQSVGST